VDDRGAMGRISSSFLLSECMCISPCLERRLHRVRLRQIGGSGTGKVSRDHRLLGSLFLTGCTVSHQMFSPRQVGKYQTGHPLWKRSDDPRGARE
jgi:hypothetical protein